MGATGVAAGQTVGSLVPRTASFGNSVDGVNYFYYVEGSVQTRGTFTLVASFAGSSGPILPTLTVAPGATAGVMFAWSIPDFISGTTQMLYGQVLDAFGNNGTSTTDTLVLKYFVNGTAGVWQAPSAVMGSKGSGIYGANASVSYVPIKGATLAAGGGVTAAITVTSLAGQPSVWSGGNNANSGTLSGASSVAYLGGDPSGSAASFPAGGPVPLLVYPTDAGGAVVSTGVSSVRGVIYYSPANQLVSLTAAGDGSGAWRGDLGSKLTVAGSYSMGVQIVSTSTVVSTVANFNVSVTVVPGPPDYTKTLWATGSAPGAAVAGASTTLVMVLRDAYSNNITVGPDATPVISLQTAPFDPMVAVESPSVTYTYSSPVYSLAFTPTISGRSALSMAFTYNSGVQSVFLAAGNSATSGYVKFVVNSGVATAATSYAYGPGIEWGGVAGQSVFFFAALADSYGNLVNTFVRAGCE